MEDDGTEEIIELLIDLISLQNKEIAPVAQENMSWLKTPKRVFFVRSGEQNPCPICDGLLKVIGSRRRGYTDGMGERRTLMIRRLGCLVCSKIHHELPDLDDPRTGFSGYSNIIGLYLHESRPFFPHRSGHEGTRVLPSMICVTW